MILPKMIEDENVQAGHKQTLCQRYGISDSQLDFKYVQDCKNPVELERILKVLKSHEVGYFKELEEATEARLREIAPNSRTLLTPQPVTSWIELSAEQRTKLISEFIDSENSSLQELRKEVKENPREYPAIRNSPKAMIADKEIPAKQEKPRRGCAPRPLKDWDKYDVDRELSLVDREDELKKNAAVRANNERQSHHERSEEVDGFEERGGGDAHRRSAANDERLKGNEFVKQQDYHSAVQYYTRSIAHFCTPEAFNNRAFCYLKLKKYEEAVQDCIKVEELSPNDTNAVAKALFRRSTALKELHRYQEAYDAITQALKLDPNDKLIQALAYKLKEKVTLPSLKKKRMVIEDHDVQRSNPLIEEIAQRDIYYPFTCASDNIPLSDIGTARQMCRCSGVPPFISKLRSAENLPNSNRLCLRKTRNKKSFNEKSMSNRSKKVCSFTNGEVIEKDTIEDDEKEVSNGENQSVHTIKSNLLRSVKENDLESVVREIVSLHPSQICEALCNRLDPGTLNLCVKALCVHLKQPSTWKIIQEHLVALAQHPQFRSSLQFLDRTTKDALSKELALVEAQGQRVSHVVTLYELNGALPPPS